MSFEENVTPPGWTDHDGGEREDRRDESTAARIEPQAPLTEDLLLLALRGLPLPSPPRVLDLCCGSGWAARFVARRLGAAVTGVDLDEALLREARERALAEGLREQVELLRGDARHVELPNASFDLVLALGGALTYMGRPGGLERIRQLLRPGGCLLISDLVYLDSPAPDEVARAIEAEAPGNAPADLALEPAVRAVFEEGVFRFESEASYRELLALMGYEVLFAFPVPESAWSAYYRMAAAALGAERAGGARSPVRIDELASFYCWGGRWGLSYLVVGARPRAEEEGGA